MLFFFSNDHQDKINTKVYLFLERNGFNKAPFSMKQEELWRKNGKYHQFDIVIYKDNTIWCIVEIAGSKPWIKKKEPLLKQWLVQTDANYGIITDGENFSISINTPFTENPSFEDISRTKLVHKLKEIPVISNKDRQKRTCSSIIRKFKLSTDFSDKIDFGKNNRLCFRKNNEQLFFKAMLGLNKKTIYRYVSFDTLFSILNNHTFRMCGLAGMNDKSEIDYFDNNLGEASKIENDIFISSCSLLKDDLTMWRLYGDDGKGVCLALEIKDTSFDSYSLLKVDYGSKSSGHKKIDLLKELRDKAFSFKEINKWKHFFKPYEFRIEKEVRILFSSAEFPGKDLQKKWVKTFNNSIVNPVVDIPLDEKSFPFKLKKIILGPKFPEADLNQKQLKEMIKDLKIGKIRVLSSKITNYR